MVIQGGCEGKAQTMIGDDWEELFLLAVEVTCLCVQICDKKRFYLGLLLFIGLEWSGDIGKQYEHSFKNLISGICIADWWGLEWSVGEDILISIVKPGFFGKGLTNMIFIQRGAKCMIKGVKTNWYLESTNGQLFQIVLGVSWCTSWFLSDMNNASIQMQGHNNYTYRMQVEFLDQLGYLNNPHPETSS